MSIESEPPPSRTNFLLVIDDDGVITPGAVERPKRRRGRPPGAKTRISHGHISADEFSVLRAVAQGIDLTIAYEQYILWPGRAPDRAGLTRLYDELLRRVEAGSEGLEDQSTARAMVRDLLNLQMVVDEAPPPEAHAQLAPSAVVVGSPPASAEQKLARPSLEEFASRFEEDMYSQQDLLELYAEEFGDEGLESAAPFPALQSLPPSPSAAVATPAGSHAQVATLGTVAGMANGERMTRLLISIDWLSSRLGTFPAREHSVDQWIRFSPRQREALRGHGVLTLGNLVDWMALKGEAWFNHLPGYGAVRGDALLLWLGRASINPSPGLIAPVIARRWRGAHQPTAQSELAVSGEKRSGLVPLDRMHWPEHLRGEHGTFRSHGPNQLQAKNDLGAMEGWLRALDGSPETLRAYRRAIERLTIWAIQERRTALSSLSKMELLDFKEFLQDPPAHWVHTEANQPLRGSAQWRPLRGKMTVKNLNLTLAAISSMYKSWATCGYLVSNPAEGIATARRQEVQMDVMRSFNDQDLLVISTTFHRIEDGPAKRRLLALIRLLEGAGLRRAEVAGAIWDHVEPITISGRVTDGMQLRVIGKGSVERLVPLKPEILQALDAHREDRQRLFEEGKLGRFWRTFDGKNPGRLPLIGVLDERWLDTMDRDLKDAKAETEAGEPLPALLRTDEGPSPHQSEQINTTGALSASALYRLLKVFFKKCALLAGEDPDDPQAVFRRASTHWLRHTYAHHALRASGKDLTVVQQILGHRSITTTAIYVKADMEARKRTNDAIKLAL